ncbi:MAG: NRDE family protein [Ferruginibacter sp.]
MCTVAFIPKGNQYYFASLRDEDPARTPALIPGVHSSGDGCYLAPTDGKAGGTWIGISVSGSIIILLNGGFKDHQRHPAYRKSRGLIVAELLLANFPVAQWQLIDTDAIEPFTLIVFEANNLFELVWDGTVKHCKKLQNCQPYIWSSATLYSPAAKLHRQQLFDNWMTRNEAISASSVLNFFKLNDDKENGFIIHRNNKMQTLSYSFITLDSNQHAVMQYYDLSNFSQHSKVLQLKISDKEFV